MPATDNQTSFLNRITIRRNPSVSINNHNHSLDLDLLDLELFQKHVSDRFSDLHDQYSTTPFLSISWLRNLLDTFLCCESEFKSLIISHSSKPSHPEHRLIPDLLERSVKALDVCNAVTHGVDLLTHWHKLAQIAVTALDQNPIGDGHVRRAKKALTTLLISMTYDDKECVLRNVVNGNLADRTWSMSRRGNNVVNSNNNKDVVRTGHVVMNNSNNTIHNNNNFRSLSWSVAKSWSAAKQVQNMSANLVAPRGAEANGPVYIMSTVLVFVMWALVAAIPCQERNGLSTHFTVPRNLGWAQSVIGLQEKIGEEWKKKEKRGACGLLEEVKKMETVARSLVEFTDGFVFPLEEEKTVEVAVLVNEMAEICRRMEEGLGPLQQQLREVFHRIVRSRAEVLDVVDQVSKMSGVTY